MISTIGVTGPIAGGKGIVADLLEEKGFIRVSLSDEVRSEARRRNLPMEREVLQNMGDSLRREFGNDILARRISSSIDERRERKKAECAVIDGLRNPAEIRWLKEHYCMCVIGVTADPEIRFQRLLRRARESDPMTREDFDRVEQRDRGVGQTEHGNQVDACLALADVVIENNGTVKQLDSRIREVLTSLGIEGVIRTKERI